MNAVQRPSIVPPHDYGAEQALLGALMLRPAGIDQVIEIVRADDFADPAHARLFSAILTQNDRGIKPSPVTLSSYFRDDPDFREIGGAAYLGQLVDAVVSATNPQDYARVVRDLADRRAIIDACGRAMDMAYTPHAEISAAQIVDGLESALTDLAADATAAGRPEAAGEILPRVMDVMERLYKGEAKLLGLPTGLGRIDNILFGLQPGNLYLLGGRPGMGKSVLGENIARHAAELPPEMGGGPVAVFSLEMTGEDMIQRTLAAVADVPFHAIRNGRVTPQQFDRLAMVAGQYRDLPLHIDATPGLTVSAIRARSRRLLRRHGRLALVVVDHLHLVTGVGDNRNNELAAITKALKGLAKELNCPVLLLSQLSRAVESREDKRPQLSDLRESGAIEQDADVVMFVFREQYYLERSEPTRRADEPDDKFGDRYSRWQHRCEAACGVGEVIVAKHRQGGIGTARLGFSGQHSRFFNLAEAENDGGNDGP